MKKLYCGTDPGKTGGIAFVTEDLKHVRAFDFPGSPADLAKLIKSIKTIPILTVLEHVHAFPMTFTSKDGTQRKQGIVSTFSFGMNFGLWQGVLAMSGWPYALITPQKWQSRVFDSVQKGKSKELAYEFVQRTFPLANIKKSKKGQIDAICMAVFARNYHLGAGATPRAAEGAGRDRPSKPRISRAVVR